MKIIESYFTFKDDRGLIKGIVNEGNWQEINYVSSKKGPRERTTIIKI